MKQESAKKFLNDMGEFWAHEDEVLASDCFQLARRQLSAEQCSKIQEISEQWLPFQESDLPFLKEKIADISV